MSAFDHFPELVAREQQGERAAQLLSRAARVATAFTPGAGWLEQAERLRGAASFAQTATAELLVAVGFLEAADAASRAGLLDIEETPLDNDPQAMDVSGRDDDER